jgi:hypothetical protein
MPATHLRRQTPDERAMQLEHDYRSWQRRRRLWWVKVAFGTWGSAALGLALMGWGLHLRDAGWAGIAFWGGLLVGNGGVLLTLLVAYLRAMEEGEL